MLNRLVWQKPALAWVDAGEEFSYLAILYIVQVVQYINCLSIDPVAIIFLIKLLSKKFQHFWSHSLLQRFMRRAGIFSSVPQSVSK